MKQINTYVCLVDNYRRPSRQRNTCGRYYVGAKTEKEAKELLQIAIGFGSIQVYYKAEPGGVDPMMDYKEIAKAAWNGKTFDKSPVVHATQKQANMEI